jgi:hypothetical protein
MRLEPADCQVRLTFIRLTFRWSWRDRMRALSYVIAVVFVLTGPSPADQAVRDLPGVGAFIYCGSPIITPAPQAMAATGR